MTIDAVDSVDDGFLDDEEWKAFLKFSSWNGRDLEVLYDQLTSFYLISQIQAQYARLESIPDDGLPHVEVGSRAYRVLDLNPEPEPAHLAIQFDQFAAPFQYAIYRPIDNEFMLADSRNLSPEILKCRSFFKKICKSAKHAAKKIGKCIEHTAQKVAHAFQKAAHEVAHVENKIAHGIADGAKKGAHFVKEHRKEILIVGAVVVAATVAWYVVGPQIAASLATAAAAVPSVANRKEEKDSKKSDPVAASAPPHDPLATQTENDIFAQLNAYATPETQPFQSAFSSYMDALHGIRTEASLPNPPTPQVSKDKFMVATNDFFTRAAATIPDSPGKAEALASIWGSLQSGLATIGSSSISLGTPEVNPLNPGGKDRADEVNKQTLISQGWDAFRKGLEAVGNSAMEFEAPEINPFKSPETDFQVTKNIFESVNDFLRTGRQEPETHFLEGHFASPTLGPNQSFSYRTEGIKKDNMLITFINGMNNSFEDAVASAEYLRSLNPGGLAIDGIYNHSNNPLLDLLEVFLLNYSGQSPIVQNLLAQQWIEFHEKHKDNPALKVLHTCHSQGAIHTYNTLMKLPKEIQDRVIVVAIAPGKIIPKDLCFDSFNYASDKDFVHYGEDLVKYISAYGDEDVVEILRRLEADKAQLIRLKSHDGSDFIDHGLQSKTVKGKIFEHFKDYNDRNGEYK